ncbi:MAG: sigma-54-dependent Fis family transcriptional regulator [Calditrichaeota bacterium]|nr:MAG: sigma-54-dependent Fis family transcriptional regulator [Calditrichota bacterium]
MFKCNLLIVEDNVDLCETLADIFRKNDFNVQTAFRTDDAREILRRDLIDLVILDLKLPDGSGLKVLDTVKDVDSDILVIMITANTHVEPAVEAMKSGAYDYIMKPFELDEVKLVVQKALETQILKREVARLKRQHESMFPKTDMFSVNKKMEEVKRMIKIVAETPRTSLLIEGESGTGKELVADALHQWSIRSSGPFIKVNCAAIPENLLESELFGHEKGAFTGADAMKKGLFEMANNGTIFLDEISSMDLALQPKILRVLETQSFRRIGGTSDIKLDVRIIAASNRNLQEMVNNGEFRDDLLYRLKVIVIKLPPLRERIDDIIFLANIFIESNNREFNKSIKGLTDDAKELLLNYRWPGNVRELKNVMERAVILCNTAYIGADLLPSELNADAGDTVSSGVNGVSPLANGHFGSLAEIEKLHIEYMLDQCSGNKSKTARELGISRSTLREKMKLYDIDG